MDEKLVVVVVGAFCGMIGYFFTTFWMKPIIQYREVKTKILIDLIFYAQVVNAEGLNEQMQKLHEERNLANRQHSAELVACFFELPCWYKLIFLKNCNLEIVAQDLMGLSNTTDYEMAEKLHVRIRKALSIEQVNKISCKKIFVVLIFAIALIASFKLYALDKNGNFESLEEQNNFLVATLKKMAHEMNTQMPIMINERTQAFSVLALDKNINFNYRIIDLSSVNANVAEITKQANAQANDMACKSESTRKLIDLGVNYVFLYMGNDNRLIAKIVFNKYHC